MPLVRYSFHIATSFQQKRFDVNNAQLAQLKETAKKIKNLYRKSYNNWTMMSLIQSGSDTRISSENKLDGVYSGQPSQHKSLTSFDDDAESFPMYVQIASTYGYLKLHTKCSKPLKLKVRTKSKAASLRLSFQLQTISTRTLELYTSSLKELFLQLYLLKNMLSSLFCQWVVILLIF